MLLHEMFDDFLRQFQNTLHAQGRALEGDGLRIHPDCIDTVTHLLTTLNWLFTAVCSDYTKRVLRRG